MTAGDDARDSLEADLFDPVHDDWRCLGGNRETTAAVARTLGNLLRRLALPLAIQNWSLTSLQQRLFKTGGRLIRHARYFTLQLAESYIRKDRSRDQAA